MFSKDFKHYPHSTVLVFSDAVVNTMTKTDLERKEFTLAYRLQFLME